MTYVPSIHYSFIIDTLLLYQKWKKLGMVTDVFGLYLYEKNGIVERFSLISASEERLEKIFCFKICLLHTEIFSKRRKIYSWMWERLELGSSALAQRYESRALRNVVDFDVKFNQCAAMR